MISQDRNLVGHNDKRGLGTALSIHQALTKIKFGLFTIWPNYNRDISLRMGATREMSSAEIRDLLIQRTLLRNLSSVLEQNFRRGLCRTLQNLNTNKITFSDARHQIEKLIEDRSPLALWTIPAYPLARLLISFGFFTSAAKLLGSSVIVAHLSKRQIASALKLLLAAKPASLLRLLEDLKRVNTWKLDAFSSATLDLLVPRDSSQDGTGAPERILIIGPAPYDRLPAGPFDRTFVLANENSRPEDLSLPSQYGKVAAVFRGRMSRKILSLKRDTSWRSALQDVSEIFLDKEYVKPIQVKLGRSVSPLSGDLIHLWGSAGNPNLFQAALAVCLATLAQGRQAEILVVGVTMYSSNKLYGKSPTALPTENSPGNFRTCQALANHDPVSNFQVPRAMVRAGLISGSEQFLEIMNSTTHRYLSSLDEKLGMSRQ